MIILAVLVGYTLGIAPFIVPKIVELIDKHKEVKEEETKEAERNEIFDEWLNGINQQDIYNEYITGQESPKGD